MENSKVEEKDIIDQGTKNSNTTESKVALTDQRFKTKVK
jgi:hypothetical protein